MALYVSPFPVRLSAPVAAHLNLPGYVGREGRQVDPQMTLRRLPDEDARIWRTGLPPPSHHHQRDEELAIAEVEEMQAVSAVLKARSP